MKPGSGLVTSRNLSKAERKGLETAVAAQRPYLTRFASDVRSGKLCDAQIQARADLYAGPVRATYSKTRWAEVAFYIVVNIIENRNLFIL